MKLNTPKTIHLKKCLSEKKLSFKIVGMFYKKLLDQNHGPKKILLLSSILVLLVFWVNFSGGVCGSPPLTAQSKIWGKVVKVADGDTITVQQGNKKHRIRLADIDCPEYRQAFGYEATEFTRNMSMGKNVTANVRAIDRYKRAVADVILPNGKSLNALLLQEGLAWWYRNYSKDKRLEAMEQTARKARKGLWSQNDPLPPWTFRRRKRN